MSDSELREALDGKHEQEREQRLKSIHHWVRFIEENPPEVWGEQQNKLVDSQLQSARESELDASHYRRVKKAGDEHSK